MKRWSNLDYMKLGVIGEQFYTYCKESKSVPKGIKNNSDQVERSNGELFKQLNISIVNANVNVDDIKIKDLNQ